MSISQWWRITANSEYVERYTATEGFPGGSMVKNPPASTGDVGSIPGSKKISWRRKWQPTPVLLPGESHGQRSLAGSSPWGHRELPTTKWAHLSHALHQSASGYSTHCKYSYHFTFHTFLPRSLYSGPMGLPYAFQKTRPACCHVMTSSHESGLSLNVIFSKMFPSTPYPDIFYQSFPVSFSS